MHACTTPSLSQSCDTFEPFSTALTDRVYVSQLRWDSRTALVILRLVLKLLLRSGLDLRLPLTRHPPPPGGGPVLSREPKVVERWAMRRLKGLTETILKYASYLWKGYVSGQCQVKLQNAVFHIWGPGDAAFSLAWPKLCRLKCLLQKGWWRYRMGIRLILSKGQDQGQVTKGHDNQRSHIWVVWYKFSGLFLPYM